MKSTLLFLLVSLSFFSDIDINGIARVNGYKSKASNAFKSGNYQKAVDNYSYLLDTLGYYEDELALNLGHAFLKLNDTLNAVGNYQNLSTSGNERLKSIAYQQLGYINAGKNQFELALSLFKTSLIADPTNDISRYNYELVKKLIDKAKEEKTDEDLKKPEGPSDYAKELKKQAERLAARFQYTRAIQLMEEGLKHDPTVEHYKDLYQRLKEIEEIVNSI